MCGAVLQCGDPVVRRGSGNAASINIISFSRRVMAVVSPLMSGLALSSGLGLVYLTAVQTSSPLAFSRKLFQQFFLAPLMALWRSRRATLVVSCLRSQLVRSALPLAFRSSAISSFHHLLDLVPLGELV